MIIPALKILNVQDTVILIILGSISTVSRIVDTIAKEAWMFYAGTLKLILLQFKIAKNYISFQSLSFLFNYFLYQGTLIDTLGMYVLSLSRGLISVCVPIEDLGKIFAVMSTLDGLNPIIMSQVYTSIWQVIFATYEVIYSIYILFSPNF